MASGPSLQPRAPGRSGRWLIGAALAVGAVAIVSRVVAVVRPRTHGKDSGRGPPVLPVNASARRAGHETEDMRGGLMFKLVLGLGTVAIVAAFGMAGLRRWVTSVHLADQPAYTALQTAPVVPPNPHLQAEPVKELGDLEIAVDERLNLYARVGTDHARIPIARALALTAGQTLAPPP